MFSQVFDFLNSNLSPIFYQVLYLTIVVCIVGIVTYFIRNIFDNKISAKWKCMMWLVVVIAILIPFRFEIKVDSLLYKMKL